MSCLLCLTSIHPPRESAAFTCFRIFSWQHHHTAKLRVPITLYAYLHQTLSTLKGTGLFSFSPTGLSATNLSVRAWLTGLCITSVEHSAPPAGQWSDHFLCQFFAWIKCERTFRKCLPCAWYIVYTCSICLWIYIDIITDYIDLLWINVY